MAKRSIGSTPARSRGILRPALGTALPRVGAIALFLSIASAPGILAQSTSPIESFWVTNATVEGLGMIGSTLYVGGGFDWVAPLSGAFVEFTSGSAQPTPGYPRVEGVVWAVAPDGAGGWYVGGQFDRVGSLPRANLVHILGDGRLSLWNPGADGTVRAIAVSGDTVYVGGDFNGVAGQPRSRLAALDAANGALRPWDPSASASVLALAVDGPRIVAAGNFTSVGGQARNHIAAIDGTGVVIPSWNPAPDGYVYSLAAEGGLVYAAGDYSSIGGESRQGLAALDASGAAVASWDPASDGPVEVLSVGGGTVYAAGMYTTIGGQPRSGLAALDDAQGGQPALATAWSPNPDSMVRSMAVGAGVVYLGGDFTSVDGQPRERLGAVDAATGAVMAWDPAVHDVVLALATSGDRVGVGGAFLSVAGSRRNGLAAFDISTGEATAWDPDVNGEVYAVAVADPWVYVGGDFMAVGGLSHRHVAAIDASSAAPSTWRPSLSGGTYVDVLAPYGSGVFLAGNFTAIGMNARNHVAEVDAVTGAPTAWNPNPNLYGYITAIEPAASGVYVGGSFTSIGGQARNRLAHLAHGTGDATAWNANLSGSTVEALEIDPSGLYVGGVFSQAGGASRANIALLDAASATALPWNPGSGGSVRALHTSGGLTFAGGGFSTIGGAARQRLAALDGAGVATAWDPAPDNSARAIAATDKLVFVGGSFDSIGGVARRGLAAFCRESPVTDLTAVAGASNTIELSWTETGAGSYAVYSSRVAGGPYEAIGTATGGTFSDAGVEGGVTYYYIVRAVDGCESGPSNEASATTTGTCSLAPDFEGAAFAQAAGGTCSVSLGWRDGVAPCGGGVTYSVYRSTTPGFSPSLSTRIAAGVQSSAYTDTAGLAPNTTYHYIVRARDASTALEDLNTIEHSATPVSCTGTPPDELSAFTVTSHDEENVLNWLNPVAGYAETVIRYSASGYPASEADGLPVGATGVFVGSPGATGSFVHTDPVNDTTYYYAAFVHDGNGSYSGGRQSFGRPTDDSGPLKWGYTTEASALAMVGVVPNTAYYTVSNDHGVHAMMPDTAGGMWPAGWAPLATNLPSEGRPLVVTLRGGTEVLGRTRVGFVASQDGRIYCFDAASGEPLWTSPVLRGPLQGAVSAQFTGYGADFDLLLVGTRISGGDNALFGVKLNDGSVAWTFDDGGGIGIISSQVSLDTENNRAYFTSHAGTGSGDTVWYVDYTASGVTGSGSVDVGPVEAPAILRGGSLLVGTVAGEIVQMDPDLSGGWSYDSGSAPVVGLWVDTASSPMRAYFSTGGAIHGIEVGASSELWTPVSVPSASSPLLRDGNLYVGSANSQLWEIPVSDPASAGQVTLGGSTMTVGRPTLDVRSGLILVGTSEGVVYAVQVPF